jgi:serine/threonine protein kinase
MVYDAFDRERSTRVAVKTLKVVDAQTLLSLKNEFRAVQDLQHPNLVSLGELFESNGTWFFTMEFVQGMHFVAYARPDDPMARKASDSSPPPSQAHARPPTAAGFDEERLRGALVQLVRGVSALHDANKLHRDLKPSNILAPRRRAWSFSTSASRAT